MLTTSATLLSHLRRVDDTTAWNRFVRLYSPLLFSWATRMGIQHADAMDLVQEVFALLVQKLPQYKYDDQRGFRKWLFTVTRNKFLEKARRRALPVDRRAQIEQQAEAQPDAFEEEEFHRHLVSHVLPSLRDLFQPSTWQAFWGQVVEGKSAAEVAQELGVTYNAAVKAKIRVLARLHRELGDLAEDLSAGRH